VRGYPKNMGANNGELGRVHGFRETRRKTKDLALTARQLGPSRAAIIWSPSRDVVRHVGTRKMV